VQVLIRLSSYVPTGSYDHYGVQPGPRFVCIDDDYRRWGEYATYRVTSLGVQTLNTSADSRVDTYELPPCPSREPLGVQILEQEVSVIGCFPKGWVRWYDGTRRSTMICNIDRQEGDDPVLKVKRARDLAPTSGSRDLAMTIESSTGCTRPSSSTAGAPRSDAPVG
jgi:hypothetical protein